MVLLMPLGEGGDPAQFLFGLRFPLDVFPSLSYIDNSDDGGLVPVKAICNLSERETTFAPL